MVGLTVYEQNILDFVALAEAQPFLFTASDRASLGDLLSTLPDDIETTSDELALWCETCSYILKALMNIEKFD